MKDVTSTSFGLVIAFLLPGFAAFFALSFWSPHVQALFLKFLEAQSNVGSFLLVVVCSLTMGLEMSILRWILFEKWLCKHKKLDLAKFAHLGAEAKLTGFRAAVDEHYRYHQFWGGMAVVIPCIGIGMVNESGGSVPQKLELGIAFLIAEIVTVIAAQSAFHNYIDRAAYILEGFVYSEQLGKEAEEGGPRKTAPSIVAPSGIAALTAATEETMTATDKDSCGVTGASVPNG
jgi:hypothetical protein